MLKILLDTLHKLAVIPILVLLVSGVQLIKWGLERDPPVSDFRQAEVPVAHPGKPVNIDVRMKADVARECDLEYYRYLIDAKGNRFDIRGTQIMDKYMLYMLQKENPDEIKISLQVPSGVSPGRARLITVERFTCNPLHNIWPIPLNVTIFLDVVAGVEAPDGK